MYEVRDNNNITYSRQYAGPERREHPREPRESYERFLWWQYKNEKERYPSC
jgi:hypothetical protein